MSPKVLEIGLLWNRSNEFGLMNDSQLLEKTLQVVGRRAGHAGVAKIRHIDPREAPVMCDILIHLEIPYYAWLPYARYNVMVVNPEWWISDAFDPYAKQFDLCIFKNDTVRDTFKVVLGLKDENTMVLPWCCTEATLSAEPVREFLYLLGGSPNKVAAANEFVKLWKPEYPALRIYTSSSAAVLPDDAPMNVYLHTGALSAEQKINLQKKYAGHVACSDAEGFGYSAAEAETMGAFCILNECDAYSAAYSENPYVAFLPSVQVANDKTRSSKYILNMETSGAALEAAITKFLEMDMKTCIMAQKKSAIARRVAFQEGVGRLVDMMAPKIEESYKAVPTRHIPPPLALADCPKISVITLIYNRKKFWDLALHNMMVTDYPRDKLEWVIVDDSDNMDESISHKIVKINSVLPGLNVVYVPFSDKRAIGAKRNAGVKRASHDILLMMDDDDHYPESSFRRRVAWLEKYPEKKAAVCTTIALYDLRSGISAVNVPPYDIPLGQRISEATLTFRRSFFEDRKFLKINMAEGEEFIKGRESEVIEMHPQHIIVSFCHGSNSSSRRIPPSDVKPACFWGFPREYLEFIHGLVGITVESDETA